MTAQFPNDIYEERETENLPGISYDPDNKRNLYSEDFQHHAEEIIAIEETLGENPQGAYETVKAWLEALAAGGSSVWGAITGTLSDQTDLQDALDAKQDALGFTAENVSNKATDLTSPDNTKYPTTQAVQNAITSAVAGLLDYRGSFDASSNLFPTTGGSGIAGAILKGDFWMCSVAGTLGGSAVTPGDLIIALVDTPGTTSSNWDIVSHDLTYVPENVANKENTTIDTSTTKYPTVNLLKTGLDTKQNSLGFTAEDVANKTTNIVTDGASDTKYPSAKAVKTYVDNNIPASTLVAHGTFSVSVGTSFTNLFNLSSLDGDADGVWRLTVCGSSGSSTQTRLKMMFNSSDSFTYQKRKEDATSDDTGSSGVLYCIGRAGGSESMNDFLFEVLIKCTKTKGTRRSFHGFSNFGNGNYNWRSLYGFWTDTTNNITSLQIEALSDSGTLTFVGHYKLEKVS